MILKFLMVMFVDVDDIFLVFVKSECFLMCYICLVLVIIVNVEYVY